MATGASTPADEQGRVHARRSFVLVLLGPAVLLVGSALVIGGLFLPWHHADARYLVGDPYPSDFQPFVPVQSLSTSRNDWFWLILAALAAIPIIATLVCLRIDATPHLRRQGLIRGAAVRFRLLTLLAGVGGIILLYPLYNGSLNLLGGVPELVDWGYFVSLAGYILLVPGAILLMIGQTHVSQLVRLGQLRAP
jgi:hypothetical protein